MLTKFLVLTGGTSVSANGTYIGMLHVYPLVIEKMKKVTKAVSLPQFFVLGLFLRHGLSAVFSPYAHACTDTE